MVELQVRQFGEEGAWSLTSGWIRVTGRLLSLYVWFGINSQSGMVSTYLALIRCFNSFITC